MSWNTYFKAGTYFNIIRANLLVAMPLTNKL